MINVRVNSTPLSVPAESTILEACRIANIYVPSLCSHRGLPPQGMCGMCMVKVNSHSYCYSCMTIVSEGMEIDTNSPDVKAKQKSAIEQFLDMTKPISVSNSPEIEELFQYISIENTPSIRNAEKTNTIQFNPKLCIDCNKCVSFCSENLQIDALGDSSLSLKDSSCISCGLCTHVCPTKALKITDSKQLFLKALANGQTMYLIVDTTAIFTMKMKGDNAKDDKFDFSKEIGKIINAAKKLGFQFVLNTAKEMEMIFSKHADELHQRIKNNGKLPLFNSHCPSFVNYVEKMNNQLLPNLETSKSPHLVAANDISSPTVNLLKERSNDNSLISSPTLEILSKFSNTPNNKQPGIKTQKSLLPGSIPRAASNSFVMNNPFEKKDFFVATLTGCSGQKDEIKKMQYSNAIDAVITVNEFFDLLKSFGIEWSSLESNASFDSQISFSNNTLLTNVPGGFTTGVLTALQRKFRETPTGFPELRNVELRKTLVAKYTIGGMDIKVAICNGISSARQLIDSGEYENYHFIEVVACPGGCVLGGGQPSIKNNVKEEYEYRRKFVENNSSSPQLINLIVGEENTNGSNGSTQIVSRQINNNPVSKHVNSLNIGAKLIFGKNLQANNNSKNIQKFINKQRSLNPEMAKGFLKKTPSQFVNIIKPSIGNSASIDVSLTKPIFHRERNISTHFEPQASATQITRKNKKVIPTVVFGGNSRATYSYARLIATSMKCNSTPMNNIDNVSQIISGKTIIFVIETEREDDIYQYNKKSNNLILNKNNNELNQFPRNGRKLLQLIQDSNDDLAGVKYSIFGIGKYQNNNTNSNHQSAAELFDKLMQSKNAKKLVDLTQCENPGESNNFDIYAGWSSQLSKKLFLNQPIVGIELINKVEEQQAPARSTTTGQGRVRTEARPIGFEIATMVERELLSEKGVIPMLHRYQLKLPEGMSYEVGDHVLILPRNEKEDVEKALKLLKYDPDQIITINDSQNDSKMSEVNTGDNFDNLIPSRNSVRQLFSQYLDLNCLPTRSLALSFYDVANEEGKAKLDKILVENEDDPSNNGTSNFDKYNLDKNIIEFIEEFAQYGVPSIGQLISAMPKIKPRLYSIASAPELNREHLDLVVLDVIFGKDNKRHGLSTYFLSRPDLTTLAIRCVRGIFRYPEDITTPILMFGFGSGVSSMFSLIQYRMALLEKKKKNIGPTYLFFGSKYRSAYPLLMRKLDNFVKIGVIQKLFTAYSRDGPKKVYIQDVLKQKANEVWELWQDHRTQVFFCGPKISVPDEIQQILLDITISEGYLSMEEAMAFNSRHDFHIEGY